MKLNFMHILADLGFGGVSPIYWNQKDQHAIQYIYTRKYACIDLQEPNEIQFGRKHKANQEESTPKCDTKKRLSKLYQYPNQHMIEEKSNQYMIISKHTNT